MNVSVSEVVVKNKARNAAKNCSWRTTFFHRKFPRNLSVLFSTVKTAVAIERWPSHGGTRENPTVLKWEAECSSSCRFEKIDDREKRTLSSRTSLARGQAPEPVRVSLKPLFGLCVPEGCLGAVLFP